MGEGHGRQRRQPARSPGDGSRAIGFVLLVAAAGIAAACGSLSAVPPASGTGPSGGTDTVASTTLPPGSSSPKDAARGWWSALAAGDVSAACGYVVPSQQADCASTFRYGSWGIADAGVGDEFVDGDQALVVVLTTNACFALGTGSTTTHCSTNTKPDAGLPTSEAGFAGAQQAAFNVESTLVACGELDGSWYVEIEPAGTGLTGGSGPSGATGGATSST